MSQQIVSTWDGVANTNSWVHDGDVERSAVDIVELASSVAGYSAGAQAAADAASGYANTASAAVASIGTAATDAVAAVQSAGNAEINDLYSAADAETSALVAVGSSWINTLTSSGGIVTSAVGDAGTAQILAVTSAGGVQVALVSAAGGSAIGDLAAVTAAQSAALVSAGGYQSGLIATAGSAQIAAVQAEGGTQIAAVQLAASAQVNSATVAAMSAGAAVSTAQGAASAASGYAVSAGSFATVTSGYMVSAGGYATSAGSAADAASGYALTASSYMTSAGGYASAASDNADAAAASAASIAGEVEQIAENTTDIAVNAKDIANIKSLLNGVIYQEQTDSAEAYSKTVPAGAQPWASVESVGGKTVVWNQLVQDGDFPDDTIWRTRSGSTLSVSDGVATVTATDTYTTIFLATDFRLPLIATHKYYIAADVSSLNGKVIFYPTGLTSGGGKQFSDVTTLTRCSWIYTAQSSVASAQAQIRYPATDTSVAESITGKAANYIICDLTLMFGAGNEPTVEQFEAMFPADYFAHDTGTLKSAGVTSIVSKDADSATLDTYAIPAAVQALPGYGWSVGSVCNEVDLVNKKYIQRVASVDLGTCDWIKISEAEWNCFYTKTLNSDKRKSVDNLLCSHYIQSTMYNTQTDKIVCGNANNGFVYIRDSAYQSGTESAFKTAMSGVMLYYELATPVETDISSLLSDDNLIEVEPGGSVSFPNALGDDYKINIPSAVTYDIKLEDAING